MKKLLFLIFSLLLFIGCDEGSNDTDCNPDEDVIVQDIVVPAERIERWGNGCIRSLDLKAMGLNQSDCLAALSGKLGSLEKMELDSNFLPTLDIGVLSEASNLKTLTLTNSEIENLDLSPIAGKRYLAFLDLLGNPWNMNLEPLSECPNLNFLRLGYGDYETIDLSFLEDHDVLRQISANWLGLETIDLTPLSTCDNLQNLSFAFNELTEVDLSPLSGSTELAYIYLGSNQIENIDLSPLDTLSGMMEISLDSNPLSAAGCSNLCEYISTHPAVLVEHDCDCSGK